MFSVNVWRNTLKIRALSFGGVLSPVLGLFKERASPAANSALDNYTKAGNNQAFSWVCQPPDFWNYSLHRASSRCARKPGSYRKREKPHCFTNQPEDQQWEPASKQLEMFKKPQTSPKAISLDKPVKTSELKTGSHIINTRGLNLHSEQLWTTLRLTLWIEDTLSTLWAGGVVWNPYIGRCRDQRHHDWPTFRSSPSPYCPVDAKNLPAACNRFPSAENSQ